MDVEQQVLREEAINKLVEKINRLYKGTSIRDCFDPEEDGFEEERPDSAANALLNSLRNGNVDREGFLDVNLTVFGTSRTKIFIRDSFLDLAEKLIEGVIDNFWRHLQAIIGPQKSGKTQFMIFILFLLVKARVEDLIFTGRKRRVFVLYKGKLYSRRECKDLQMYLYYEKIWCLLINDWTRPKRGGSTLTVHETSLKSKNLFVAKSRILQMPPLTEKELQKLNLIKFQKRAETPIIMR